MKTWFADLWAKIVDFFKPKPSPAPSPAPVPPVPPAPTPRTAQVRASLWWPKFGGGYEGTMDLAMRHGSGIDETAAFKSNCEGLAKLGANTFFYIADSVMVEHPELFMFLTNAKSPVDGHRMNDKQNDVVIARSYGINTWIVSLFNDETTHVADKSKHEAWIRKLCGWYDWAGKDELVLMICLECSDRFTAGEVVERVKWCKQYKPECRVLVGNGTTGLLNAVASLCEAQGLAVELALETPWHPLTGVANWPAYIQQLKDLKATGCPVWWGEAFEKDAVKQADLTAQAEALGVAGYLFGRWAKPKAGPLNRRVALDNSMCMGSGIIAGN